MDPSLEIRPITSRAQRQFKQQRSVANLYDFSDERILEVLVKFYSIIQ